MAIFHLDVQVISRGQGRSAVACIAYRAAERIQDERLDKAMDFSKKKGVEHKEILAPERAPGWVYDRGKLWNAVEAAETRINSRVAREVQVALPVELSREARLELVRSYIREQFVSRGMIADFAIHTDNPQNPHAHIMLTTREITPDGFGEKNRTWNAKDLLLEWREEWAKAVNLELARTGHDQRIDHRSYAELGIDLEPQSKIGISKDKFETETRDFIQDRIREHQELALRNGERIRENPAIALEALTQKHATFTKTDVGRWLNTRTSDAEQFQACLAAVMGSKELVRAGEDRFGRERFTTREMLEVEKGILRNSNELDEKADHRVGARYIEQAEATRTLDPEQRSALWYLTERTNDIAVVEGYAGTGKSYMLGAAREAWEAAGYQVRGAALAGKAAEGLEVSSGIASRSIHAWEYAWRVDRDRLTDRDIFVIDEAGMVGSRQLGRVLEEVKAAGAKVVIVGDTEQLQAIEAGAPMRAVGQQVGQITLSEIRRQGEAWQREATKEFATGGPGKALDAYEDRGHVRTHETQADAFQAMVKVWDEYRRSDPAKTQIMMAFRRVEVQELNDLARGILVSEGKLGAGHEIECERGKREFSVGDRVYFLKNDRYLGVKNGTLGTVERIEGVAISVRLDGEDRRVVVDTRQYNHLDHGYAATVHKAQGVTVDRAQVLASELFDRHATYVGMSRHRERVDLHWSKEVFGDRERMIQTLSRARPKEMAIDFERAVEDNRELAGKLLQKDEKRLLDLERWPPPGGRDREAAERQPDLAELREARKRYLAAQREAKSDPLTAEKAFEGLHEVYLARQAVAFQEKAVSDMEKRIEQLREEHGVVKGTLVIRQQGLPRVLDEQKAELAKAEATLSRVLADPSLKEKSAVQAREHNDGIKRAKRELAELRPLYERGEREIPEVVIARYRDLEFVARGERWTAQDRHAEQSEVREVKRLLDQAEAVHTAAVREREAFELEHPVKARMGIGQIVELRSTEERTKEAAEKARETWRSSWEDPNLQARTRAEVKSHNQEIDRAKKELGELQPAFERAVKVREQERERDRGQDKDRGMERER